MNSLLVKFSVACSLAFLATSALAGQDINPMQTTCADEVLARNNNSIAYWSTNVPLTASRDRQWLTNTDVDIQVKVETAQYNAVRKGQPAWVIVRFYLLRNTLANIQAGIPNAAIGGFSNNFMYVQPNGRCYVSEDRYDDLRDFSQPFAYKLASYIAYMGLDLKSPGVPPDLDRLYKAMTVDQLKAPINAAVERLIQEQHDAREDLDENDTSSMETYSLPN